MERRFLNLILLSFLVISVLLSCKKEGELVSYPSLPADNRPPVAHAGPDQVITLPVNSVTLDASNSTDPDNNITSYQWKKIAGPSSFLIANVSARQTVVNKLIEGVYQFELKVTDAGGLFSHDTMQVMVMAAPSVCGSDRPEITARLLPIGTLSNSRIGITMAAAGNKIVFAGGLNTTDCPECWGSPQVDIFDVSTNTWTTAKLSTGRFDMAAVTAGNKIFFAGGEMGDGAFDTYYSNVDIYDVTTNAWTIQHLSRPRSKLAAGAVGNYVVFAGGEYNWNYDVTGTIDIYNISTGSFSQATLSQPRAHISAVTANNKIYFAGGSKENRWYNSPSDVIDVFDNVTGSWSTSSLSEPMLLPTATTLGGKIYWGAGCTIEIKDIMNSNSSIAHPFKSMHWGVTSITKDNYVLFLSGVRGSSSFQELLNKFDIYNPTTNTWSIGVSPVAIKAAISHNNIVYATDGVKVYKLEF